jgi:hypothetical protein
MPFAGLPGSVWKNPRKFRAGDSNKIGAFCASVWIARASSLSKNKRIAQSSCRRAPSNFVIGVDTLRARLQRQLASPCHSQPQQTRGVGETVTTTRNPACDYVRAASRPQDALHLWPVARAFLRGKGQIIEYKPRPAEQPDNPYHCEVIGRKNGNTPSAFRDLLSGSKSLLIFYRRANFRCAA